MTGPEHYREAERLIGNVNAVLGNRPTFTDPERNGVQVALATAQVHATLALAAATAAAQATAYDGDETHQRSRGWSGVA